MTIQLAEAAQAQGLPIVTTLDDEQYERLDLIVARPIGGGPARLYCLARDWDRTPAGRISQLVFLVESQQQQIELLARRADATDRARDLERQLETLRNENEELRADLARRNDRSAPPAPSIPRRDMLPPAPPAAHACPDCARTFDSSRALKMHRWRAHGTSQAATTPDDDVLFVCAACHSDAFTRDLHEPTICIRCARSLPRDWAA